MSASLVVGVHFSGVMRHLSMGVALRTRFGDPICLRYGGEFPSKSERAAKSAKTASDRTQWKLIALIGPEVRYGRSAWGSDPGEHISALRIVDHPLVLKSGNTASLSKDMALNISQRAEDRIT